MITIEKKLSYVYMCLLIFAYCMIDRLRFSSEIQFDHYKDANRGGLRRRSIAGKTIYKFAALLLNHHFPTLILSALLDII